MRGVVIISLVLMCLLSLRFLTFFSTQHRYKIGEKVSLTYTFLDEPKIGSNSQHFRVGELSITTQQYPEYHYGDTVMIKGNVESNLYGQLVIKNAHVSLEKSPPSFFLAPLAFIRQRITHAFETYLSSKDASLLLGIVFGIKSNFDSTFYTNLRNTGVLHIIAASGMNVTLVAEFLLLILLPVFQRRVALVVSIAGIILYAILSGLQASIFRAALMSGLSFSAQVLGRQYTALYVLCVVAFIMLMIQPSQIADVGFQLSFASTLGILLVKPLIDRLPLVEVLSKRIFLFEDFSTTVSAQLATVPLFFITFGTYSPISIIVNLLILWTVPFLMILGGVAAIIGIISPVIASVLLYLCIPLLWYFEWIISVFSHFSSLIELKDLPISIWFGYYLILLAIVLWVQKRSDSKK